MLVEDKTVSGDFEAFEDGAYSAVIVGVLQGKSEYQGVLKDSNMFLLQVLDDNGHVQYKTTKGFSWSLTEKSNFAIMMSSLLKTANEQRALKQSLLDKGLAVLSASGRLCYDTEKFLGWSCVAQIAIKQSKKDPEKSYAMIERLSPLGKKTAVLDVNLDAEIPDYYHGSYGRPFDHIDVVPGLRWKAPSEKKQDDNSVKPVAKADDTGIADFSSYDDKDLPF